MSSVESLAELIPVERVAGLWPRTWIAVGAGFQREEIKGVILDRGFALSAEAVTSLADVAARVIGKPLDRERVLGAAARQEVLRTLVSERRISEHLVELKRLKRQAGFFRKLDQAIQASRMAVAHADEEEVLAERLRERLGEGQYRPLRDEIRILSRAYEAWLEGLELWDTPRLLREAAAALAVQGWPEGLARPEEILFFSAQTIEALEQSFCDELSRHLEFRRVAPPWLFQGQAVKSLECRFAWERWHTLDDAADGLADRLAEGEQPLSEQVVLIPDNAAIRRTLKRAFELRGIPLADTRDPNRLRWDERLKWALLPLEVVARDFERTKVVAYLRTWQNQPELPAWVAEISSRGIRQGLASYSGGFLSTVHSRLNELAA